MSNSIIRRRLPYAFYNASLIIIALNVIAFLINNLAPRTLAYMVLNPQAVRFADAYWQFFTYMFAHGSITHILFNMLGLFFFGAAVEQRMGSNEFVLFYLLSGILAGLASFLIYVVTGSYNVYLLGASGAVYAVLLAYATYYPDSTVYVMGILPLKAPVLVVVFTALAVFSQIFSVSTGVAHLTHLAGFVFAYLYFVIRLGINPISVFLGNGRNRFH